MYGAVISLILLFPWTLVALATIGHLRSRRAEALVRGNQTSKVCRPPLTSIVAHVTIKAAKRRS
jgi:hypothetical protein